MSSEIGRKLIDGEAYEQGYPQRLGRQFLANIFLDLSRNIFHFSQSTIANALGKHVIRTVNSLQNITTTLKKLDGLHRRDKRVASRRITDRDWREGIRMIRPVEIVTRCGRKRIDRSADPTSSVLLRSPEEPNKQDILTSPDKPEDVRYAYFMLVK